jgi:PAS domain S-box-containing protein
MRRIDILQDIDRLDLFDAVPAIILMLDETGRILYFNAFMEALGGYSLKEVRGKDWFELFLPEREIKRVREIFAEALAGHATRGNINAIITKSGEERLIRWYDQVMNTEQQGRHYLLATGVDITERRKAEESQSLLHSLVDNSNDAIEVIEPGTLRFLYVNDTECRQLGYSREELLGMSVNDIDIMSAEQVKVAEEQIRRKGSARFETIHRRKDGSSFPVEISVKLIELDKP